MIFDWNRIYKVIIFGGVIVAMSELEVTIKKLNNGKPAGKDEDAGKMSLL